MNDDALINLIENNNILYDKTHLEYKNAIKKKEVWEIISQQLCVPVDTCMKRWTNLREKYGREMKKGLGSSGSAATPESSWIHLDHMHFLRSHIQPKRQRTNFSTEILPETFEMSSTAVDLGDSYNIDECIIMEEEPLPKTVTKTNPERSIKTTESDTAFLNLSQALTTFFKNSSDEKGNKANSFGKYVASCLDEMAPAKQARTIRKISNVLSEAEFEPDD